MIPDTACLRVLGKSAAWVKRDPLYGRATKKGLGWACKLDGAGSQGITKVGQMVLARLMEGEILCLPVHLCWWRV